MRLSFYGNEGGSRSAINASHKFTRRRIAPKAAQRLRNASGSERDKNSTNRNDGSGGSS